MKFLNETFFEKAFLFCSFLIDLMLILIRLGRKFLEKLEKAKQITEMLL